jgi:hypothetical protein
MEGGKCTSTNQAREIELIGAGKIFSLAENFLDRLDWPVLTPGRFNCFRFRGHSPSNVAKRGTIRFGARRKNWITIHETHEATLRGFGFESFHASSWIVLLFRRTALNYARARDFAAFLPLLYSQN